MILETTTIKSQDSGNGSIVTFYIPPSSAGNLTDIDIVINQDETYSFTQGVFVYTDSESNNIVSIKINSLPQKGNLTFQSNAVILGQVIPIGDVGDLNYMPFPGESAINYAQVGISVIDDGPVDNESNTATYSFNVLSLAQPTVSDNEITIEKNENIAFAPAHFSLNYSDDSSTTPTSVYVKQTSLGNHLYQGTPFTEITIPLASVVDLTFNSTNIGVPYTSFIFKVSDNQGIFSDDKTMIINVVDVPTQQNLNLGLCHGHTLSLYNPISGGYNNSSNIAGIEIDSIEAGGVLTASGLSVGVGDVLDITQLQSLFFTSSLDDTQILITFRSISDQGVYSNPANITISIGQIADFNCNDWNHNDFFVK